MLAPFIAAAAVIVAAATPQPTPRPGEPVFEQVRENALVGEFGVRPDGARHPAVIVLGGFGGGIPDGASTFALQGYAGFAVAYFGAGSLPKAPELVPVDLVSRAVDYLRARSDVDPARIGLLGVSKGAELALLAATREKRIASVAVIAPSAYVWFAPAFGSASPQSSWAADGAPLPFIPPSAGALANLGRAYDAGATYAFRNLYDASLAAAPPALVDRATIPVEQIGAPLLCAAGGDDRQWDSAGACRAIAARRHAAKRDAEDVLAIEPDAGHFTSLGGRPSPESVPAGRMTLQLGGSPAANAHAAADVWARTMSFFGRTLARGSSKPPAGT